MTKGAFIIHCKEKFPQYLHGLEFKAANPDTLIGLVCTFKSKVSRFCDMRLCELDRDGNVIELLK